MSVALFRCGLVNNKYGILFKYIYIYSFLYLIFQLLIIIKINFKLRNILIFYIKKYKIIKFLIIKLFNFLVLKL